MALIALAIGVGASLGAVNGLLVWRLDIPPIVVTLGTLTIYRGLIFVLSGGAWINAHQMSPAFKALPRADPGPAGDVLGRDRAGRGLWLLIARTALGRAFFAVGGNPRAAVYAGIDVGRTRFWAFTLAGRSRGWADISGWRAMPWPMWTSPEGSNWT